MVDANDKVFAISGLYNDGSTVGVIVYPIPGANIVATDAQIRKSCPSVEATLLLPRAYQRRHGSLAISWCFGRATCKPTPPPIAVLLVIGVVFVFLQSNPRSTWIPAVALPVIHHRHGRAGQQSTATSTISR